VQKHIICHKSYPFTMLIYLVNHNTIFVTDYKGIKLQT